MGKATLTSPVVCILLSPLGPTVFAESSSREVSIFVLKPNGGMELRNKIELILEFLGCMLSVLSINWMLF
jgi:hypothetical protein